MATFTSIYYRGNLSNSDRELYGKAYSYNYEQDTFVAGRGGTIRMIRDQVITDKGKPKLAAMDAALRNTTMYLSSRHNGRFHSIWHDGPEGRVFICEWRNPEPITIMSKRVVSLKEVFDYIEQHVVYMPAIALDGDQDK